MKRKITFLSAAFMLLAFLAVPLGMRGQAPVNTVLWGETWTGGSANQTPSDYTFGGTTVYGGTTLTYAQSSTNTKLYNEALAGGESPELLLSKNNQTWTISNIPTGQATEMSLTFKSNKTAFAVTSTTDGINISGSQKSWTISATSSVSNFDLTIQNTSSSNARIDDIELIVTTAGGETPAVTYHTLAFSANPAEGGTVTVGDTIIAEGATTSISATANAGYVFGSWTVTGEGSSVNNAGDTFTMGIEDATLTANFTAVTTYTVTYHANVTGIDDIEVVYNAGDDVTVAANTFLNPGFAFSEWNTQADGDGDPYVAGDVIENIQADIDLYAQWEESSEATATLNIQSYASAHSWANGTQYLTATVDDVTFTAAGGSNTGKYYTSGQDWRYYQGEGATITISVPNGYHLVSITPTYNTSNGGVLLNGSATIQSGSTVDVSGTSVTFSVGNSGSATNGQVRFTNIDVIYGFESGSQIQSDLTITNTSTDLTFDLYNNATAQVINYTTSSTGAITITPETSTYFSYVHDADNKTITVTPLAVTPNAQTVTISQAADDNYYAGTATFTVSVVNTDPDVPGTLNNPYTVAQARAAIDAGAGVNGVYATGIVSAIVTDYSLQYENITFDIVDVAGDEAYLRSYRCGGDEAANVRVGDVAVVYGNLIYYNNSIYEFAQGCEVVSLTHPVVPSITINPATVSVDAEEAEGALDITYENLTITGASDFDIQYYNAQGEAIDDLDWILAEVNEKELSKNDTTYTYYEVTYVIDANEGEARTAYFKVYAIYAMDDETNLVYSNLVTINQEAYVAPVPSITITPDVVNVDAEEHDGTLDLTYENLTITEMGDFDIQYYDAEGEELTENPDWIEVLVAGQDPTIGEGYVVSYIMNENNGEARSAYFKVYAMDDETNLVYSNLVTVNQAAYVAPVLDYAELPFEFNGGRADIENTDGLTQEGLDSDYGSSPKLKFNTTGDWVLLHFNEEPGELAFDIKGNSFSGGTFTVQTSVDGETYEDLATYTELGSTEHETFNTLAADVRYIKWIYTEKVSGNVALGNITLAQPAAPVASITVDPDVVNVDAEGGEGTLNVTYTNITEILAEVYFCDANGEAATYDWIVAEINAENNIDYLIDANEGEARIAYLKVYALDDNAEDVYSNLVTINQAAPVVPPTPGEWVMVSLNDLTENDVFVIVGVYDVDESSYAMPNNSTGAPSAVEVTMVGNTLSGDIDDNLQWNLSIGEDGYTFYPNGETETWLYCTNTNNGVRVGTNENNVFSMTSEGYLFNNATERYIGIYNSQDWRCYTSINNNIKEQTFAFYKRVDGSEIETYTMDITGYGDSDGGYYLIASPVSMIRPTADNGFLTEEYDLYRFDQTYSGEEWRNYKAKHFNIATGKGYLYASLENTTLTFTGVPYTGNGEITLTKDDDATFSGWNLVGNPFGETAYINRNFYVMNEEGTELVASDGAIAPMQGVFVIAEEDGEPLTFSTTPTDKSGLALNLICNNNVVDRAIVRFGEGRQLPKFQLNPNSTKVYIPQGAEDFAVVRSANQGEMPVSFKASENGTYTFSVNAGDLEVEYLHLIDNMIGTDVDLLATPSYTFEANTTDYTSRFRLVFSTNTGVEEVGNASFAYYNGSQWVVSNMGEATLQVVDVMGRVLSTETINGNAEISLNQVPGVYMIRLVNGNDVKVQKVVVK